MQQGSSGLDTMSKTAFKKFCAECLKAGISIQPLTNLLSIIYGENMVALGMSAVLSDKLSRERTQSKIWQNADLNSLIRDNLTTVDSILIDIEDVCQSAKQELLR